ncbi:hypothetical protein ACOMHN_067397 [Nucella lapillus]
MEKRNGEGLLTCDQFILAGLYNAGKRTLIRELDGDTLGLYGAASVERTTLKKKNLVFLSWDLGGRESIRPLARHFYQRAHAIIYMVDSQDRDLFENGMVRDKLQETLTEKALSGLPLLVLANKQDLPGAFTCPQQIRDMLELGQVKRKGPVEILPVSLVTGEGLPGVRDWLDRQLHPKRLQEMVVEPLEKAVPPSMTSAGCRVSSALKQAFGLVKKKLP